MKLIVGLGNPGSRYAGTRHNVGFEVVDCLAKRWSMDLSGERFHGWFAKGQAKGNDVALLKPTTFMNRSGRAVLAAGRFYRLELPDLMVITDDMALPLGRVRMRAKGSSGGHNGLQDIIDRLSSQEWCRLRVGVGAALGDPIRHVLEKFRVEEEPVIKESISWAADAVESWLSEGIEQTMTRYNGDPQFD